LKVEFSAACKQKGNRYFHEEDYQRAVVEYERSLSVFQWIESSLGDKWKQNPIEDKDLLQLKYSPMSDYELQWIKENQIANLLNLSLCYLKMKQFSDCISACDLILSPDLDPVNVKALYRRSQARSIPLHNGMTEQLLALEDLKKAISVLRQQKPEENDLKIDKDYGLISAAYQKLSKEIFLTKQFEKKHFRNLFAKISSHEKKKKEEPTGKPAEDDQKSDEENEKSEDEVRDQEKSEQRAIAASHNQFDEMCNLILSYSTEELQELIKEIEEKIIRFKKELQDESWILSMQEKKRVLLQVLQYKRQQQKQQTLERKKKESPDFLHPTDDMIQEAKEFNLDLTDVK
jgi:tetratricopeptide (TPR) repeat protein